MKSKLLLHQLIRVIAISSLHLTASVFSYLYAEFLSVVAVLLVVVNMLYLIRYFSRSAQYFIAMHAAKKHKNDALLWWNALLGIIVVSLLFYAFFVMLFVHVTRIIETL